MKICIFYKSFTGNTEKITNKIVETLRKEGENPDIIEVSGDEKVELYNYDLIFLGTPVIEFLPARHILDFIKNQLSKHRKRGDIVPTSPKIPGKYAVCYLTYSGPHTGIREAIPAMKYMEQFFEHLRFTVVGEWYIVGEFKNNEELSTKGVLGDIRGRPNDKDLSKVERQVKSVLRRIASDLEKSEENFMFNDLKFIRDINDFPERFKKLHTIQRLTSSLDERTSILVKIGAAVGMRYEDCTKFLILEALRNGISEVEIRDTLLSCSLIGEIVCSSFIYNIMKDIKIFSNL